MRIPSWRFRARIWCLFRGGHDWTRWNWSDERVYRHRLGPERVRMRSRRCLRCGARETIH